jgi:hypothetical protein
MMNIDATSARRFSSVVVEAAGSLTYRTLSFLGAIIVAVFLTAGCNSPTGPTPLPPSDADEQQSTPDPTPDPTPEPFRVTDAAITVTPDDYSDVCPTSLQRTISITVNGSGTVRWALKSNSGTIGEFEHDFAEAGTLTVNETQDHQSSESGWLRVKILEPNDFVSNTASYEVSCVAKVTKATLAALPQDPLKLCPISRTFLGTITVDGVGFKPTEIKYRFARSDGSLQPTKTLVFDQAGTKMVTHSWGNLSNGDKGWVQLVVMSPNSKQSSKFSFTADCISFKVPKL